MSSVSDQASLKPYINTPSGFIPSPVFYSLQFCLVRSPQVNLAYPKFPYFTFYNCPLGIFSVEYGMVRN